MFLHLSVSYSVHRGAAGVAGKVAFLFGKIFAENCMKTKEIGSGKWANVLAPEEKVIFSAWNFAVYFKLDKTNL